MNLAQAGRLWRFAPGKISMLRMEHTLGVAPVDRAMRGVTPALSARRRPLHRRLVESEKPTASRSDRPKLEHQSVKVALTLATAK
jgi:hypothetical protein